MFWITFFNLLTLRDTFTNKIWFINKLLNIFTQKNWNPIWVLLTPKRLRWQSFASIAQLLNIKMMNANLYVKLQWTWSFLATPATSMVTSTRMHSWKYIVRFSLYYISILNSYKTKKVIKYIYFIKIQQKSWRSW